MASANTTGGVMGKMIDAQSIVVAAAATGEGGREGELLRAVFWHSVALALLVGVIVMLYAHVFLGRRGLATRISVNGAAATRSGDPTHVGVYRHRDAQASRRIDPVVALA